MYEVCLYEVCHNQYFSVDAKDEVEELLTFGIRQLF